MPPHDFLRWLDGWLASYESHSVDEVDLDGVREKLDAALAHDPPVALVPADDRLARAEARLAALERAVESLQFPLRRLPTKPPPGLMDLLDKVGHPPQSPEMPFRRRTWCAAPGTQGSQP
jgi:hypothetical protein